MIALLLLPLFGQAAQDPLPEGAFLRLAGHTDGVKAVAWSADGRFLLTGSRDQTLAIWNARTGERIRILEGHADGVTAACWSGDGKRILSGSQDKTLGLWDAESGKRLRTFTGHRRMVTCAALSADGLRALSGSTDHTAVIWDVETGKPAIELRGQREKVLTVAFTPDGKRALTGGGMEWLAHWDAMTGELLQAFTGHKSAIFGAAFIGEGSQIIAGDRDKAVVIWDAERGSEVRRLEGHVGWVESAAAAPDGRIAATGSYDLTVILWDLASGKRLDRLFGHTGRIYSLAFSPGGRRLASASEDGFVYVWDLWAKQGQRATAWHDAWKKRDEAARRKDLRELLGTLKDAGPEAYAEARERILRCGAEAIRAILDVFDPQGSGPALPDPLLKQLLKDLDDPDPAARLRAKKALVEAGRGVVPWIEGQLKDNKRLSSEVRGLLVDVKREVSAPKAAVPDDGRERAVLILLEMEPGAAVAEALRKYSEGPEVSPATRVARRAMGK